MPGEWKRLSKACQRLVRDVLPPLRTEFFYDVLYMSGSGGCQLIMHEVLASRRNRFVVEIARLYKTGGRRWTAAGCLSCRRSEAAEHRGRNVESRRRDVVAMASLLRSRGPFASLRLRLSASGSRLTGRARHRLSGMASLVQPSAESRQLTGDERVDLRCGRGI